MPAAKRPKLLGNTPKSTKPQQNSAAPATVSSPNATPTSSNSSGAIDWEAQCRQLQRENARLSEQLAAAQSQLQTSSSGSAGPSTAGKQKAQAAAVELLKYTPEQHTAFLRTARRAPAIVTLDLTCLDRTTSSFAQGNMSLMAALFAKPKWRPDKKVDAVLAALMAGPDDVRHLDLGDASWATEDKYAQQLVKLLRKYKKAVTNLSITMRALVQPSSGSMSKSQVNVLDIIGAMPSLTNLELTVTSVDNHYSAYGGEFRSKVEQFGNKRPKVSFAKLKEIELYLTRDWFDNQFSGVDDFDDFYEHSEDVGGGGGREECVDDRVPDLLQHRKDVVTHLDMSCFRKTRVELPIVDLLAGLTKLRTIALRSDFLHVIKDMTLLESVELHVVAGFAPEAVQAVGGVLANLTELEVALGPAASGDSDAAVAALAGTCSRLKKLCLVGNGWRDAALSSMLRGAAVACIEDVRMAKCGGVLAQHFPALASMPSLKSVSLPLRLQAAGAVDPKRPGLVTVWE